VTDVVWYAIYAKPQQEARAYTNIIQQGFTAFLPLGREKGKEAKPLFPRYLFAEIQLNQNWAPLMSTRGVSTILSDANGFPVPVSASVIAELRAAYDPVLQAVPLTSQRRTRVLVPGKKYRVVEGPLMSLDALFVALRGDRAEVLMDIAGRAAKVTVSADALVGHCLS